MYSFYEEMRCPESSNVKTKGLTFRYLFGNETKTFWYRSRIFLVDNGLFWSRICSPGPIRNDLFRWGRFGNELRCYGFIPVRCRNVCGTFVERLFLSVLTLLKHSLLVMYREAVPQV
jgi:hypothetical protein